MFKVVAFVALSAALSYLSRSSLQAPGSHGFYRFFAWECILALFLLNVDVWLKTAFAWHQLLSWTLLIVSIVPHALGIRTLIAHAGKHKRVT